MKDAFDANEITFKMGAMMFDCEQAFERLLEANPWLARQFLDDCEEKVRPRSHPAQFHRAVT